METIQQLDARAKRLAKNLLRDEAEILLVLIELRSRNGFEELECSGVFDYCVKRLNLSREQSYYFKSVAEKDAVPEIQNAVVQGDLSLSQARRIVTVLTPENKEEWIGKAKVLSQDQLEREVSAVNPRARPKERIKPVAKDLAELKGVCLTPEAEENVRVLLELLSQRKQKAATLSEVIDWATKVCRDKFDPERKAKRSLKRKSVSGKPEGKLGRHPILDSVKHQVVSKKGFQCWHVGTDGHRCEEKRWIDFHHIIEVWLGGLNTVDNLELLCDRHHRVKHRKSTPTYGRNLWRESPPKK
jgi:5-methylcytosine-specific restriction endonuclease McrA